MFISWLEVTHSRTTPEAQHRQYELGSFLSPTLRPAGRGDEGFI